MPGETATSNRDSTRNSSNPTSPTQHLSTTAVPTQSGSSTPPATGISPSTSRKNSILTKVQANHKKPISRQGSIDDGTSVAVNDIDERFGKLTEPWEEKKQPNTGRCYYVNHRTKTSQWED